MLEVMALARGPCIGPPCDSGCMAGAVTGRSKGPLGARLGRSPETGVRGIHRPGRCCRSLGSSRARSAALALALLDDAASTWEHTFAA